MLSLIRNMFRIVVKNFEIDNRIISVSRMCTYGQIYYAFHVCKSHMFMKSYNFYYKNIEYEDFILFIFENDIQSVYFSCSEVIQNTNSYYYVTVILIDGKFKYFILSRDDFFIYRNHDLYENYKIKEKHETKWKEDGF
mgnify:FL=1